MSDYIQSNSKRLFKVYILDKCIFEQQVKSTFMYMTIANQNKVISGVSALLILYKKPCGDALSIMLKCRIFGDERLRSVFLPTANPPPYPIK